MTTEIYTCKTCPHSMSYEEEEGVIQSQFKGKGECRFDPPKVFMVPGRNALNQPSLSKMTTWPPVTLDERGCSKHPDFHCH
jgi:hypothetical protein